MDTRGYQSRDVGHVDHQVSTDLIGDFTELLPVNDLAVGRGPGHDQLGLNFFRNCPNLIVVQQFRFRIQAVSK